MAVVKADAYGHGALRCARAALEAGADWLGTATPHEALALRAAGITDVPVMCWLWTPGDPWDEGIEAGLDMSVSGMWALREVVAAARATGKRARVQLKADTGLGRNGCQPADWPELVGEALKAEAEGLLKVTGLWSHLACADEPHHPSIAAQLDVFRSMLDYAEKAGVEPEVRHIANSPATLTSRGPLRPRPARHRRLRHLAQPRTRHRRRTRPAARHVAQGERRARQAGPGRTRRQLRAPLRHRRRDHPRARARRIRRRRPRHASGRGPVLVGDTVRTIAGRVAMDQFVLDLGGETPEPGTEAVLFGPGDRGEPTAEDWAVAADTIAYEIVTRIGARVPRVYPGE